MAYVWLGVPTSAGSHHAGQDLAPAALRAAGLLRRLHLGGVDVEAADDVRGAVWTPAEPDDTARHVEAVAAVARGVTDAVEREVARGRVPLVVGGDCTITLGVVAGVQRGGASVGLAYLDGDADLSTPQTTASGVLDAMGIAHLLGLADDALARVGPTFPMLTPDEVVLLGYDPGDLDQQGSELPAGPTLAVAYRELAAEPERHAAEALAALGQERLVVHFDVDVVDGRDLALANFPHYGTGVRSPSPDACSPRCSTTRGWPRWCSPRSTRPTTRPASCSDATSTRWSRRSPIPLDIMYLDIKRLPTGYR